MNITLNTSDFSIGKRILSLEYHELSKNNFKSANRINPTIITTKTKKKEFRLNSLILPILSQEASFGLK